MKKSISILFALLVIASMALASCAQPTPETIVQTVVVTEVVEVEGETVVETQVVEVVVTPEPEPEMEEETVLRIMSLPWPQTPVEQELADELFTPATGIKVEITGPPYDFVESKMRELCASQSSEFDIYETDSQWYGGIIQSGCIEPLDPYLEASGIDYDATFVQPYATYNGRWPVPNAVLRGDEPWEDYTDQPVYFMPWTIGSMILAYQPQLFVDAGIVDDAGNAKVPETWDEFREAAKALTTDERWGAGWYATRLSDGITLQWLPFHTSMGSQIWDEVNWQAEGVINSPEAVEACEYFTSFVLEDGSVDPATATWFVNEELNAAFNDLYAMTFTWVSFAGAMDNPEASGTAGKWAYAPFPCEGDVCSAAYGSQGIGINAHSEQKDAAWQYLEWYHSPEVQQALIDDPRAGYASANVDLLDYQLEEPGTARWASLKSITEGWGWDVWTYPEYAQLLDTQQQYLNLAYVGEISCQEALDQIATLHQRILDTSPNNPANQ